MVSSNPLAIVNGLVNIEGQVGAFIKGDIGGDSPIANHFRDQYRARCEEYTNAPGWLKAIGPGGKGNPIGRICKPYLDDNDWSDIEIGPPFDGGQCDCVKYQIRVRGQRGNGNNFTMTGRTVYGPIGGVRIRPTDGRIQVFCRGLSNNTCLGVPISFVCGDLGWKTSSFGTSSLIGGNARIDEIVRCDGQPDNCGNPEDEPIPGPNPAPRPDPIRLPDDEPFIDPNDDGDGPIFGVPVNPFPDPFFGDGFPTLDDGLLPDGFGGGSSGGGGAGRPFDGIDGQDGGDEDFPDPPDGEVWVGAYLEITGRPTFITSVPGSGPENEAFYRVIGNFSLYSIDDGKTYRTEAVQVRSAWTKFIGSPVGLPISGAYVNVLPNVQYTVYPVSAPVAEEE